uniref:DDE Tnp4 domain-containing protein n=1 Tax=Magallana gigas TaxID=29159 RepID=A0A8W8K9K7_MAGGI
MTTESANTSRLVTKIRWVVESANSRIKQWNYLQHVLPTSQIPYIGDFIRIVCAICNRYMKPLSNGNATEDESLECKMLFLSKQVNALQQHVEEHHLDRRSVCWEPVDDLREYYKTWTEQIFNIRRGGNKEGKIKNDKGDSGIEKLKEVLSLGKENEIHTAVVQLEIRNDR